MSFHRFFQLPLTGRVANTVLYYLMVLVCLNIRVAVSRGLNGIGLAMVQPAIQSLVDDSTEDHNQGIVFGWIQLTGNLGSMLSVLLASTSFYGIAGWRIAFHLVALVSIIVGIVVRLYGKDSRFVEKNCVDGDSSTGKSLQLKEFFKEAKSVMKIPTFQIVVSQGVTGSFGGAASAFIPLWLEVIGFSHKETAFLMSMYPVACSIGGLFGGKMGDILSVRLPNSCRIILSQISAVSFIPLAWILQLGLPYDPSTAFKHGLVLFIIGLFTSWNAPSTNNAIFAEIVLVRSRTSIYALDQSFENILASFAPPVVGLLSQHVFGYRPAPQGSSQSAEVETDRKNAASLAKALYASIAIPFTICVLVYSFMYCTYLRDRDRGKMKALIESEMEQLESQKVLMDGKYSQIQASKVYEKETVIELDY
ncbi:uncharacterized protein LOC113289827 isoform X2 [Papaver somniferum]|uniref:uncharacterized protein LOC113289827 isoform X2 n=1 Tax=Papaver somniferum TaxID=3469 RepID=UPI000E701286|nr:uncharacterized protein LOC113289827 isoform X2 [Papaver somniferum]